MPGERPPALFFRLHKGIVRESLRVVHVVPVPERRSDVLVAYCGALLRTDLVDRLEPFHGMPCAACLITVSRPAEPPALSA